MKTKAFLLPVIMSTVSLSLFAQNTSALRQKEFNLDNKVAINKYDPVAYFKVGKAVKGKSEFIVNSDGVYYYFSNAENRDEFKKNPSKYEPQYGGWCAYAMGAKGEKVSIDPETFKIIDGKLYLFYNSFFNNTLKSWNKDETHLKANADANWIKIFR
jgi:YHS domain-containing protein